MAVSMPQTAPARPPTRRDRWWEHAFIYQIYPRSFSDSNGDGVGDIPGVIERLDYLQWLGVDALWLNPVTVSANLDWGYDVVDYRQVQPELGSMVDVERLVARTGERGIAVILDIVPNHTSDRHPWFLDARSSRSSAHRDWYVWADPGPAGGPPNNWTSVFSGSAWTFDAPTGQYYLHNFLPSMPDLNWWNREVRREFESILRFWFDRGVAGFRIDVANSLVKDRLLRDNPPATAGDDAFTRQHGQRAIYNMNRPEVHEIYRAWRRIAQSYDPHRLLLGETFVFDFPTLGSYYGVDDELQLAFNFPFGYSAFGAAGLADVVDMTLKALPSGSTPVWMGSNHDLGRLASRWAGEHESRVRAALLMLLTLPGTVCLYFGDELGLPHGKVPREALRDPVGTLRWPDDAGRDPGRTPMIWDTGPGRGFTAAPEPWLPFGTAPFGAAAEQAKSTRSILALTRRLIALRRSWPSLREGGYTRLASDAEVWVWERKAGKDGRGRGSLEPGRAGRSGEAVTDCIVAINMSEQERTLKVARVRLVLSTTCDAHSQVPTDTMVLGPWEGVLLARD